MLYIRLYNLIEFKNLYQNFTLNKPVHTIKMDFKNVLNGWLKITQYQIEIINYW